jgi:hypothetical protein
MRLAAYLSFHEASGPIRQAVTKFGGNPVWLTQPQWPLDPQSGKPMLFLGQVFLDPEIFGNLQGRLAYLFLPASDPLWATPGYHAAGNVVLIQPGASPDLPAAPLTEGPSVCRVARGKRRWLLLRERIAVPSEFAVSLTKRQDPEIDWEADDPLAGIGHDLEECKIGGEPVWIQDEDWPYEDSRHLLLQLVWDKYPFHLALGDAGTLWAFLSRDGSQGTIRWQCY